MLSAEQKAGLKSAVECMVESHGMEWVSREGPVAFIDGMISAARRRVRVSGCEASGRAVVVLTENREEAERYLAGLMGMM